MNEKVTVFRIKKQDGKAFICSRCGNDTFDNFIIKSTTPQTTRHYQVLKCIVTCSLCDKSNMIYHTKIRQIKLLQGNALEVL